MFVYPVICSSVLSHQFDTLVGVINTIFNSYNSSCISLGVCVTFVNFGHFAIVVFSRDLGQNKVKKITTRAIGAVLMISPT